MKRLLLSSSFVVALACTGKFVRPTTDEKIERTAERLERGKYLVDSVGVCGSCHTSWVNGDYLQGQSADGYLAGGNSIDQFGAGFSVWVPNLTPDPDTGLGKWT